MKVSLAKQTPKPDRFLSLEDLNDRIIRNCSEVSDHIKLWPLVKVSPEVSFSFWLGMKLHYDILKFSCCSFLPISINKVILCQENNLLQSKMQSPLFRTHLHLFKLLIVWEIDPLQNDDLYSFDIHSLTNDQVNHTSVLKYGSNF